MKKWLYDSKTFGGPFLIQIYNTRISGPDGPLILAVDLRNTPKGGGYGRTHARTHTLLYIYRLCGVGGGGGVVWVVLFVQ